ncbi:MAG: type II toxin-antitoxin system RelE/ParE family toxin [Acidobacteria bacterium]|nr:type II toxin-antitoxin system RelE/ParE family toxin [Acidobacteriota bacterium]
MEENPIPKKVLWVGADVIYVLHCFQKKSKRGAKTPERDREMIRNRLNEINKSRGKEKL